jgi:hypothetical protein
MKNLIIVLLMVPVALFAQRSDNGDFLHLKDRSIIEASISSRSGDTILIKKGGDFYLMNADQLTPDHKAKAMATTQDKFNLKPNLYLQGAGKMGKASLGVAVAGSLAMVLAVSLSDASPGARTGLAVGGAALNLIALGMQMGAWNRVQMAGVLQSTKKF